MMEQSNEENNNTVVTNKVERSSTSSSSSETAIEVPESTIDLLSNHGNEDSHEKFSDGKETSVTFVPIVDTEPVKPKFTIFGYAFSQIKWSNVVWLLVIHVLAVYGYIYACVTPVKVYTYIFMTVISIGSGFGMSVGGHRLWSHRAFKARFLLRLVLTIFQTMTVNGSVLSYARDHRNHHKWPATDADPKNPARGFFFAHVGWWMLKKKPEVIEYGKKVPLDDLLGDPLIKYQHKFYIPLVIVFAILIPTFFPYFVWNESVLTSFLICCCIRIVVVLHHLFTVNSVAHFWGDRPYNQYMRPAENRICNYISMGEGKHNYHHTFPYDYSNSEKKWWEVFNPPTLFIDVCTLLGLAYDCKKPSKDVVVGVIERKGLPDYFEADKNNSLAVKIIYGLLDWCFGAIFSQWPVWPIIIFKLLTGQQLIVL